MTTWLTRFEPPTGGTGGKIRVSVKDVFDLAGVATTAGCVAVRDRAVPAPSDAACLAGVRASDAFIVGKTTLTEMCVSPSGLNPEFGSPVNPVAPDRVPGGSSSGSAVAVATGEADIGLGTDSGGSIRIPAACCGIVGLKTTWGRISTAGVWPLAASLDVVGPLARDVARVVTGMALLEPGWSARTRPARTVGRLRIEGVDQALEEAVDAALAASGLRVIEVDLLGWVSSWDALDTIMLGELWRAHPTMLDAEGVTDYVNNGLRAGRAIGDEQLAAAMLDRQRWQDEVAAALDEVELLALPTLMGMPPTLDDLAGFAYTGLTAPFNLAGVPALSMPVPSPGLPVPVGLQLVGPSNGEDLLCSTGLVIEQILTSRAAQDPGDTLA